MSTRPLLNLFLFLFVLALIAIIFFEPGKETAKTPPSLTSLNKEDVSRIKIVTPNKKTIELIKDKDTWKIVSPYQNAANTFRINALLKLLSSVSLSKYSLSNLDKNQFGLTTPSASIQFNDMTIYFGHNKSLKNHRYVQVSNDVHLIADTFYYKLSANPESYIDHKILPIGSKITKLILPSMTLSYGINKETDISQWNIQPVAGETSADSINQLISEWELSQAFDLKVIPIKKNTKADVSIELSNKQTLRFSFTDNKNKFELINLDTGIQYILSSDRKDKLLKLSGVNQDDPL
ncbi:MAG: DUF4340 domain-containing protein [Woeseiaceae bacterium]